MRGQFCPGQRAVFPAPGATWFVGDVKIMHYFFLIFHTFIKKSANTLIKTSFFYNVII